MRDIGKQGQDAKNIQFIKRLFATKRDKRDLPNRAEAGAEVGPGQWKLRCRRVLTDREVSPMEVGRRCENIRGKGRRIARRSEQVPG